MEKKPFEWYLVNVCGALLALALVAVAVFCALDVPIVHGATLGDEADVYYSVFDFDFVASDSFTYPFVGGTVTSDSVYTYGRLDSAFVSYIGTENYMTSDALSGQQISVSSYNASSASRWTLRADSVYWDTGYILKVYDYNDNVAYTNFTISFEVVDLVDASGQYEVISVPISISEQAQGSMLLLHSYVNDRLSDLGYNQRIVRLDNFVVSIEGIGDGGQLAPYYLVVSTSVSDSSTYGVQRAQRWLDEYDLPVPSADVPIVATEFLADILEPFLGFEIIPGVSLGGVLAFVATVALVFWFITLLV